MLLDSFSEKDVDGKFYRAILDYAKEHRDELIARSWGELSPEDKALLDAEKAPPDPVDEKKKKREERKRAKELKKQQEAQRKLEEQMLHILYRL